MNAKTQLWGEDEHNSGLDPNSASGWTANDFRPAKAPESFRGSRNFFKGSAALDIIPNQGGTSVRGHTPSL